MIPDGFWHRIKNVQKIHCRLYDAGLGWIIGGIILLLRHTGRKTGTKYATPLQYERIGTDYFVGAARGRNADWFRNIQVDPNVQTSVGSRVFRAIAEPVTDPGKVADFLEYRLTRHPIMIGLMMRLHHLPMRPSRQQLLELAQSMAVVILHPLVEHV